MGKTGMHGWMKQARAKGGESGMEIGEGRVKTVPSFKC